MRARRAPAALRLEQRADPRRARRGGERRALVPRPLGARRRVGAHLHELRRRVLAQALARARGAARVARGVVEGEPRLGGVAPTDARVQCGARRAAVGARALPVPSGSTPPAAATSAIRRARFASAMCGSLGSLFLSLTRGRESVGVSTANGKKAHTRAFGGARGVWPRCTGGQQKRSRNKHAHSIMNTPPRGSTHALHPCTSRWYSAPDCAPATSLGQCTATLCSGPGA